MLHAIARGLLSSGVRCMLATAAQRREALVWGIGLACATVVTPLDGSFPFNALFVWGPQLVALAALAAFRVNQSVRLAVAVSIALVPVAVWGTFQVKHVSGEWWWTYLLLWPGMLLGAWLAPYVSSRPAPSIPRGKPSLAALSVVVSIAVNLLVIGATLGWK